MTVLGPILPDEMGITDGHNHVWIDSHDVPAKDAPVLNQSDQILAELKNYRQAGGTSQLDCQPVGCGRDGSKLRWLSQESGVHIVANTGFHLREYYPHEAKIWQLDYDQATYLFIDEIEKGLIETRTDQQPVYPGFIKIAVRETFEQSPEHLISAAVNASLKSGYLIEMHTQKGQSVEEFVEFITGLGLPAEKLVICHIDKRPDPGLHRELAAEGFLLEYDTFFRPKYDPEKNLWPLIEKMAAEGFDHNLVLATDLADGNLWAHIGGGPGITGFVTVIKERLEKMGLNSTSIHGMMGGNIARSLALS